MTTTTTSTPVYAQLIARLETRISASGATIAEKTGWVQIHFANGHRVDIRKDKSVLPIVDTTVNPTELSVKTTALDKPNGRVQCYVPLSGNGPQALAILEKLITECAAAGTIPPKKRGAFKGSGAPDLFAFEQSLVVASPAPLQVLSNDSSEYDGEV